MLKADADEDEGELAARAEGERKLYAADDDDDDDAFPRVADWVLEGLVASGRGTGRPLSSFGAGLEANGTCQSARNI